MIHSAVLERVDVDYGRDATVLSCAPKHPPRSKSPLRYPGGKTRAVSTIRQHIPADVKEICSPFFGGGSVELSCAVDGVRVHGSDAFEPVVAFWQEALREPELLAKQVRRYYPLSRTKFYALQKSYPNLEASIDKAAVFYVLNRSSFSGTTLSGGMSPGHPRFTESSIQRLHNFGVDGVTMAQLDFSDALEEHKGKFLYLDPPYANGGKLYGKRGDMHDGFDHQLLADLLKQRDGWVLSYNDCKEVREWYDGWKFIRPEWTYGMNGDKISNEVLIIA